MIKSGGRNGSKRKRQVALASKRAKDIIFAKKITAGTTAAAGSCFDVQHTPRGRKKAVGTASSICGGKRWRISDAEGRNGSRQRRTLGTAANKQKQSEIHPSARKEGTESARIDTDLLGREGQHYVAPRALFKRQHRTMRHAL